MLMPVTIRKRSGAVVQASSWSAWRKFIALLMREPCAACDGQGHQEWMIEASGGQPTRWFPEVCRSCRGRGWVIE